MPNSNTEEVEEKPQNEDTGAWAPTLGPDSMDAYTNMRAGSSPPMSISSDTDVGVGSIGYEMTPDIGTQVPTAPGAVARMDASTSGTPATAAGGTMGPAQRGGYRMSPEPYADEPEQ